MPVLHMRWRDGRTPTVILSISPAAGWGLTDRRVRTRATVSISTPENLLSETLINRLGLVPAGYTEVTRNTETQVVPFYWIDLHLTLGLLGALVDRYTYTGVAVVAAPRGTPAGLVIGSDLIRRGGLSVDADGVTLCL